MTTRPLSQGSSAPDFTADGTRGSVCLSEWCSRSAVVLLFYPLAFTPVCADELPALDDSLARFREQGVELMAISVDSLPSARAFASAIGLRELTLVSDYDRQITRAYGVLRDEGFAERATFVIDQTGVVRAARVSDLMVKRDPRATLDLLKNLRPAEGRSPSE